MGSDLRFVEYVLDQIDPDCTVTHKKMFGEFGLYSAGKLFSLICDDRLFVKPTDAGRAHIGDVVEAPPYPGARPYFAIGAQIEDREWLSQLVRITAAELPDPKSKKPKKPRKPRKPKPTPVRKGG
jgi:TfoX/Sxy family transcriptional regulator of competence genes